MAVVMNEIELFLKVSEKLNMDCKELYARVEKISKDSNGTISILEVLAQLYFFDRVQCIRILMDGMS